MKCPCPCLGIRWWRNSGGFEELAYVCPVLPLGLVWRAASSICRRGCMTLTIVISSSHVFLHSSSSKICLDWGFPKEKNFSILYPCWWMPVSSGRDIFADVGLISKASIFTSVGFRLSWYEAGKSTDSTFSIYLPHVFGDIPFCGLTASMSLPSTLLGLVILGDELDHFLFFIPSKQWDGQPSLASLPGSAAAAVSSRVRVNCDSWPRMTSPTHHTCSSI